MLSSSGFHPDFSGSSFTIQKINVTILQVISSQSLSPQTFIILGYFLQSFTLYFKLQVGSSHTAVELIQGLYFPSLQKHNFPNFQLTLQSSLYTAFSQCLFCSWPWHFLLSTHRAANLSHLGCHHMLCSLHAISWESYGDQSVFLNSPFCSICHYPDSNPLKRIPPSLPIQLIINATFNINPLKCIYD